MKKPILELVDELKRTIDRPLYVKTADGILSKDQELFNDVMAMCKHND